MSSWGRSFDTNVVDEENVSLWSVNRGNIMRHLSNDKNFILCIEVSWRCRLREKQVLSEVESNETDASHLALPL